MLIEYKSVSVGIGTYRKVSESERRKYKKLLHAKRREIEKQMTKEEKSSQPLGCMAYVSMTEKYDPELGAIIIDEQWKWWCDNEKHIWRGKYD